MVRLIERREDADSDRVFEFRVYPSPTDGEIFGYLVPFGVVQDRAATFIKTDYGEPVAKAFNQVLGLAEHHGMDAVWVHDPDGLFPPEKRPVVEAKRS